MYVKNMIVIDDGDGFDDRNGFDDSDQYWWWGFNDGMGGDGS